jgi:hypothetical protein
LAQAKLAADAQQHASDNQTKIAIENAKLTHSTIQQQNELAATPQPAAMPPAGMPPNLGAPNGNQ